MKKLFTLTILASVFAFSQSSAQIQKGEKMLGASLGTSSGEHTNYQSTPEATSNSFNIWVTPQLGFGIGNNWILGISGIYTHNKNKNKNQSGWGEGRGNSYGGGLFARKFSPIGERFGLFGQADATYEAGKNKSTGSSGPGYESEATNLIVSVKPGGYFRANKRFIFETTVGSISYARNTSSSDGGSTESVTTVFGLALVNTISISFKVVL